MKMRFESYLNFEEAKTGEWIHNQRSLMDCINHPAVVNIAWLDPVDDDETRDEIINVVYRHKNNKRGEFNIIVPYDVIDKDELSAWMQAHPQKVWKGNHSGEKIRGIDYR